MKALEVQWPDRWLESFLTGTQLAESRRAAVKDQRVLNGIEAQMAVVNAGGAFWKEVREWGMSRALLTPMEAGILSVATGVPNQLPSEKQSVRALGALRKLRTEGFQEGKNLG